jgi:hypothetical protein
MGNAAGRLKEGSAHAAEVTKRTAQRTKLNGDLELLKRKIRSTKQEFGVRVFPAMSLDQRETATQIFEEYSKKVERLEAEVRAKQAQIDQLSAKKD